MLLLSEGNSKLGASINHVSLIAGASCPGASEWCAVACYAKKGRFRNGNVRSTLQERNGNVRSTLQERTDLAMEDLPAFELLLRIELDRKRPGSVVRIHASGDFFSAPYVHMWTGIAQDYRHITFFGYTRSWDVKRMVRALDGLRNEPNVRLWASTDPTMEEPEGWNIARVAPHGTTPKGALCPEQTGRRADCASCGLCWKVTPNAGKALTFTQH